MAHDNECPKRMSTAADEYIYIYVKKKGVVAANTLGGCPLANPKPAAADVKIRRDRGDEHPKRLPAG